MRDARPWSRLAAAALLLGLLESGGAAAQTGSDGGGSGTASAPEVVHLWREGDEGIRLNLRGRVLSSTGAALEGARIQLWQADGSGSYRSDRYRGVVHAGRRGAFVIDTALPGQYYGAKHIHVVVTHDGYQALGARLLFKGDPNMDPGEDDLAVLLEEVNKDGRTVMVGNVELVLEPVGQ